MTRQMSQGAQFDAALIPEGELEKYPVRSGIRIGAGRTWNVGLIQAVEKYEHVVSGHDFIILGEGK